MIQKVDQVEQRDSERFYELWQEIDDRVGSAEESKNLEAFLVWSNLSEALRNAYELCQHEEITAQNRDEEIAQR